MAASRIYLVGNSIIQPYKPFFRNPTIRFPSVSLRFRRFCTPAAAATAVDTSPSPHPWPEWVTFIDHLNRKGYFSEKPAAAENGGSDIVYREMNLLKDACLSFARDRYDLLKSLSLRDIQALVERGCPNLLRKAVNSSKRLRAHVRLDEGDVCSTCDLRDSCDRAYVILKDSGDSVRTEDVMRVLLFKALDPLMISGEERSSGRELADESARKLLLELVELSEKSPHPPPLPKPAFKGSLSRKERALELNTEKSTERNFAEKGDNQESNDAPNKISVASGPKRGDWYCPKCNFLNFAKNEVCRDCKEVPANLSVFANVKEGDWLCPECKFFNFSRNGLCVKCKAKGPKKSSMENAEMKKGDWNCPGCGFMNFTRNKQCLRCQVQRPKRDLNPGEWECPSCDFLNYRRNTVCKKCNCKRPQEATPGYEEHSWRRPS
ncbi:PREDICTED: zinc finger protein VAR3, chloroplastic [Tarenaya hassleriana]|uniref:zinc finger protein VAR3, chloroplastic n=1 Tax=Tarenaya hassleriana TaxID=28532 RepID=UPI00053C6741|nr:PREDICTED: zinc finger protein VAR3, chloroplastic [Tarenaya hassleriana]